MPEALIIRDPVPFGEVPLAPPELTGVSEAQLAHAMVKHLAGAAADTDAEALAALRRAFPRTSLATRVAALAQLTRR